MQKIKLPVLFAELILYYQTLATKIDYMCIIT